ncbi:Metallo-dependent hydrolase [Laetiporus sulphureus 93-53]|uniref:Metallo-dependent hydrolase n=1 Tax=Laetiporus sulphureus 93-53 TaxID=1314785 RepID=A0A165HR90_9APHY|nr:Metallo-dependent hydrolase [Laetiporus sulphureus 93-53]KZT12075.1 Metallo-dependent hydrolase [Laetiporus sulphureus 93-53]
MLIRGDLVHCSNLGQIDILQDYLLDVNDEGILAHVAPACAAESQNLIHNAREPLILIPRGGFLLPTFCDLHLHAPQFLYQGTGLHLPLMKWLDEYAFKAEESLDADPVLAEKVYARLAARLIEYGTGAVLLFGTINSETNLILAKVMQKAGIRAYVGKLSMDISSRTSYVEHTAEAALSAALHFSHQCRALFAELPRHARLVEPVLTPRFVPTCSDELLKGLGDMSAQDDLRVQSHMAEAHDQMEWVKRERGMDDMAVFARNGLLTPRTIQAHCTFLSPPSLSQLSQYGTAVAHCPLSNAYFSAKPFPLREALQAGVKVGLGTDIAGGYDINIMSCMRQAVAVSRIREGSRIMRAADDTTWEPQTDLSVDWKEALYLATRGGAIALGLPDGCGLFVVGVPFDAQHIRLFDAYTGEGVGPLDFFDDNPLSKRELTTDMIEKWWCIGDGRNRCAMWVQGKRLV